MEGRRIITTKAINTQLKYHWTLEKFCTHYNVSEEEFFNTVATLFPKGADEVRRKLQKNENFKHGKKRSDAKNENKVSSDIPEKSNVTSDENEEKKETEETVEKMSKEKELLVQEEARAAAKREQIISLEVQHEKLISRKREIQTVELLEYKKILEKHKKAIIDAQEKVIDLTNELDRIIGQISEVNSSLSDNREELKSLEDEIKALKTVNILVYNSGEIEIVSDSEIKVPADSDIEWISIVTNNPEQCKSLTMGQIQGIAKVLKIVGELNLWQVEFDNKQAQDLFEKLLNVSK